MVSHTGPHLVIPYRNFREGFRILVSWFFSGEVRERPVHLKQGVTMPVQQAGVFVTLEINAYKSED